MLGWLHNGAAEDCPHGQAAVRAGLPGIEVLLLDATAGALLRIPWWMAHRGDEVGDRPSDALARAALGFAVGLPDYCTDAALDLQAGLVSCASNSLGMS